MNIGKPFVDAWNIYRKNWVTMIVALIILVLLSILTLGILYIPLFIGFQMLFVNAKRGKKISANDILAPISRFFSLFFGNLAIGILILFGLLLLIVPGLAWAAWWLYAILFIYDKNMHIEDGMKASKDIVRKNGTWWHLLFLVLVIIVDNIFVWFVPTIGMIMKLVTTPIAFGAIACAYADESK